MTLEHDPIITQQVMDQELELKTKALLLQSTHKRKAQQVTTIVPAYSLLYDLTKLNEDNMLPQDIVRMISA